MEMTGLEVDKERIIEVAAIVTDKNFNPIADYTSVIYQPPEILSQMDEWNQNQHGKSGLLAKIPTAPKQEDVEQKLCDLVAKEFGTDRAIMCGNSISQDRKFIDRYMPKLAKLLHYRLLDVTAWKIIMGPRFGVTYEKKDSHRALDDIKESIAELKTFVDFIETKKK